MGELGAEAKDLNVGLNDLDQRTSPEAWDMETWSSMFSSVFSKPQVKSV